MDGINSLDSLIFQNNWKIARKCFLLFVFLTSYIDIKLSQHTVQPKSTLNFKKSSVCLKIRVKLVMSSFDDTRLYLAVVALIGAGHRAMEGSDAG